MNISKKKKNRYEKKRERREGVGRGGKGWEGVGRGGKGWEGVGIGGERRR